jgi:DedD protein
MEPELKQRIIGTVVVTALAAIFIPMLFDEPVDDSGKAVAELSIPKPQVEADLAAKLPASKEQVLTQGEPELSASELNEEENTEGKEFRSEAKPAKNIAGEAQQGQDFIPPGESDSDTKEASAKPDMAIAEDEPLIQEQKPELDTGTVNSAKLPVETTKPESVTPRIEKEKPQTPAAKTASVDRVKPVEKVKPDSKKKTTSKLVRWSIQAGSFSKKENAQSLVEKLRKQGMPASIVAKGNLFRVKVGPELDKKKAADMKAKLDRLNITSYLHSE